MVVAMAPGAACPSEVMVPIRHVATANLLLYFVGVQVFKQVSLLPLVVTDVESVPRHVLLLSVKVFYHRQSVVIGALLHRIRVACLLDATSETTLVLYVLSR